MRAVVALPLAVAAFCVTAAVAAADKECGADLCVGPQYALKRPSEAAAIAKNGQSIGIAAGLYHNDVAIWRANDLTIRGIGGHAHMKVSGGVSAESKAIWVIKGNSATVERIEFSGASVPHMNGAGIRLEGTHLTLRHCYFHDNQTGLLTGQNAISDIVIEHSEFANSRAPQRNPHGLYIGGVRSFTLKFSYVHHAHVGHLVKSRARYNYLMYNRIMDEADGTSSYSVDLPNGGIALLMGNVIQQGPLTENDSLIAYGSERHRESHPDNALYLVNNTLVSELPNGRFVFSRYAADRIMFMNNVFVGAGDWFSSPINGNASQPPVWLGNVAAATSEFVDAGAFDYRPRAGSRAIDAGVALGTLQDIDLVAAMQYVHKLQAAPRAIHGRIDAGAFEFEQTLNE